MNYRLQKQLIEMKNKDINLREKISKAGILCDGYHPDMEELHLQHSNELTKIIDKYGWPNPKLVGKAGTEAAWLILQHSISRPQLIKRGIKLIKTLGHASGVSDLNQARTIDRICFFEGKKQIYGTNFDWDINGSLYPTPVIDEKNLNTRRNKIGLKNIEMRSFNYLIQTI